MNDDLTELGLTRVSRRQQQRSAALAQAEAHAHPEDAALDEDAALFDADQTELGSRRGAATSVEPATPPTPAAPLAPAARAATAATTVPVGTRPAITKPRLATSPALPGTPAAREHYPARAAAPVMAQRRAPSAPSVAPAPTVPGNIDHAAFERAATARARRRALWLVAAIAGTLFLLTAGILLAISILSR